MNVAKPSCFNDEQWENYSAFIDGNFLAKLCPSLLYCEDCTASYRSAMSYQNKCDRRDDPAVIKWLLTGRRQGQKDVDLL